MYLSKYYEVSQREVIGYLDILTKDEITEIIKKYGIEDKEIKNASNKRKKKQS